MSRNEREANGMSERVFAENFAVYQTIPEVLRGAMERMKNSCVHQESCIAITGCHKGCPDYETLPK